MMVARMARKGANARHEQKRWKHSVHAEKVYLRGRSEHKRKLGAHETLRQVLFLLIEIVCVYASAKMERQRITPHCVGWVTVTAAPTAQQWWPLVEREHPRRIHHDPFGHAAENAARAMLLALVPCFISSLVFFVTCGSRRGCCRV